MLLTEILTEQRIRLPLRATSKEEAITELVDLLAANGALIDRDKALTAILERERTHTTGIGNGLAIPHGKTNAVADLVVAVGRAAEPIDFQSIDQRPVSLVIMLLSPMDKTGPHIQALAHVSRLMLNDAFRLKLLTVQTPAEMFQAIRQQEQGGE